METYIASAYDENGFELFTYSVIAEDERHAMEKVMNMNPFLDENMIELVYTGDRF